MTITTETLDQIETGLAGVTPGPWDFYPEDPTSYYGAGRSAAMCNDAGEKVIDCLWASATERGNLIYRHIARLDPQTVADLVRLARIGLDLLEGREQYVRGFRIHLPLSEGDF
jgi:hypothetical protein